MRQDIKGIRSKYRDNVSAPEGNNQNIEKEEQSLNTRIFSDVVKLKTTWKYVEERI